MSLLLRLSLRNLLRQKRRNLLLGSAMAIGMALLILANSFAHGISDVLFNRILAFAAGHISVNYLQGGNRMTPVFRDGPMLKERVREALPSLEAMQEAMGLFARAVGNGRSDNVILVAMDLKSKLDPQQQADLEANFHMIAGEYRDLNRTDLSHPVLIAEDKAKYLRLGLHDVVRVRFQDVEGRQQAARLTVAGIFKPANVFMSAPVFLGLDDLKAMAGYGPHDTPQLFLQIADPKTNAIAYADRLHEALKPPLAAAWASLSAPESTRLRSSDTVHALNPKTQARPVQRHNSSDSAWILGYRIDSASLALTGLSKQGVYATASLAQEMGLSPGDTCTLRYCLKYPALASPNPSSGPTSKEAATSRLSSADDPALSTSNPQMTPPVASTSATPATSVAPDSDALYAAPVVITGILPQDAGIPGKALLLDDKAFFALYYRHWPATAKTDSALENAPWRKALNEAWVLLPRTRTTADLQRKYAETPRLKTKAAAIDVATMYETASMVVQLEVALNLITLVAVLILFFIIQVGVVNTLRMTIRERTPEIGTMRAIGMQRNQVRNLFLLETLYLTTFASLVGIALAFAGMHALASLTFQTDGNPIGMLLVSGHLHFLPKTTDTLLYFLLILGISTATAWFPARRAARLQPSDALRHFG